MLDDLLEWLMDHCIAPFVLLVLLLLVVAVIGIPYAIYSESRDPHISLNKTEWHCSHSHTIFIPISNGKTTTILPEQICDNYRMNGYE